MIRSTSFMQRGTLSLLLVGVTINYIDRQTLSVLAPTLQKELSFSSLEYSYIVNSFLVVYSIMYAVAGRMVDVFGTRHALGFAVIWWSVAQITHAYANGVGGLCASRALLAMGEAAIFPSLVKAVAEWFSPKQSGLAIGIIDSGLSLGPILAPPLVVWITLHHGWRYAFLWTGLVGLLWAVVWLWFYRTPAAADLGKHKPERFANRTPWAEIFRSRKVWAVAWSRFFGDPVWYFYLFWLPKYLTESKGLDLESVGAFAWIPYAASLLGGVAGGASSTYLIRLGCAPLDSRMRVMLWSGMVVSLGVFSIFSSNLLWALFFISAASFGMLSWGVNLETLPADIFPPSQVAQAVGLCGMMASAGGILFMAATGYIVQHFSYTPIWIASAVMYPIGFVILSLLRENR